MEYVQYNHETSVKLNVAVIGCGGHAFRNILPTFQYAPINLVAVCDLDLKKAESVGRLFGAKASYDDYHEMLANEKIEAVFVITGYDGSYRSLYPQIAIDCMRAGCHVWIEKPPASSSEDILKMIKTSKETNKKVMVGFKKMFFPSIQKVKQIIESVEFKQVTSVAIRYPQGVPFETKDRQSDKMMLWFLDHLVHPLSILVYLFGEIESIYFNISSINGASTTNLKFRSGVIGSLHLAAGSSDISPLERLEVVGEGANVVVENGVKLTYYRRGNRVNKELQHLNGGYGRMSSYIGDDEVAPIVWEPEFSLGQLYNKNIFMLGYAQEIRYFCQKVLDDSAIEIGNLNQAFHILKVYEAYKNDAETKIEL
ncbi:MAG: Gfo/Idh/MocA family oxidoreductase [Bacilli bacterium]|nr:Gfo/Idh/MocA family oxidoreductase [Bacilli bacterium]MBN2696898.1 Gfo/Idh/MocA family oxidoreductase [Bacilli bacterium]